MELQEILGCLGNADKLAALPLSALKAAAEKYPYISQLKVLLVKKEANPSNLKEHVLSSTDHTLSPELLPELGLNESDATLLIKIVKKESTHSKKSSSSVLSLKKDHKLTDQENLTLIKASTSKSASKTEQTSTNQPIKTSVKKETSAKEVSSSSSSSSSSNKTKSKVANTSNPTSTPPKTPTKKKTSTARAQKVQTPSNIKSTPSKRTYTRKKTLAKKVIVGAINPPLPHYKDILSKVQLSKASAASKSKTTKASLAKTRTNAPIAKSKQKGANPSLALSQNKKELTKVADTSKNVQSKKKLSTNTPAAIGSKKDRLKFSEWLTAKSNKVTNTATDSPTDDPVKPKNKKKLKKRVKSSVVKKEAIATVTLAKLYTKQGHYKKAIKVYERLRLLNPEKSSFFASKISKLKQK